MKKNLVTIAVILMFALTIFSGCTEQQSTKTNTNNGVPLGSLDLFSVDSTGGQFSVLQDTVEVNVYEGSVSTQQHITVEYIENTVDDASKYVVSCYEFGPDGFTFEKPIEITLYYDTGDFPAGVAESDLSMYVYNGNIWEFIEGSYVNQQTHAVIGQVSHFSQIACCGPAPTTEEIEDDDTSSSSDSEDEDDNTSALYWFKADACFYNTKTPRIREGEHIDTYLVGVSAYWDPVPYVQYYQIKYEFHGNPPADYASQCDFRDQGSSGCTQSHVGIYENTIYQLGGDPNNEGFIRPYDGPNRAIVYVKNDTTGEKDEIVYGQLYPDGKHGFVYRVVQDHVDDWEGLSEIEIANLVNDMQEFLSDYVDGWEIWVRGVTERGD